MRYVANSLNLAKSTVHDKLRQFQESGSYKKRQDSDRKRCTAEREEQFTLLFILRCRRTRSIIGTTIKKLACMALLFLQE